MKYALRDQLRNGRGKYSTIVSSENLQKEVQISIKFLVPQRQFRQNYTFAYISFINSFSPWFPGAKCPEKRRVNKWHISQKEKAWLSQMVCTRTPKERRSKSGVIKKNSKVSRIPKYRERRKPPKEQREGKCLPL